MGWNKVKLKTTYRW